MKRIAVLVIFCSIVCHVNAQVDTIYSLPEKWMKANFKEGTSQYLVFFQNKKKAKLAGVFVWDRKVSKKKTTNGEVIEVAQKWYSSDTTGYRYVHSLVDAKTFSPIYHKTISSRSGVEAFDFYDKKIEGSDSVVKNTKNTFTLETKMGKPLNWELDMETFSLLDLKAGKRFAIFFYHPGGRTEPKFYEYKVVGDEKITSLEGKQIDCWKLRIDYTEKSFAVFYISKKSKEVLKMEEDFGVGVRYKVKLGTSIGVN